MNPWMMMFLNQYGGQHYSMPWDNSHNTHMPNPFQNWQNYLSGQSTTVPKVPSGVLMNILKQNPQYANQFDFSQFLNPQQLSLATNGNNGGSYGQGSTGGSSGSGGGSTSNTGGTSSRNNNNLNYDMSQTGTSQPYQSPYQFTPPGLMVF